MEEHLCLQFDDALATTCVKDRHARRTWTIHALRHAENETTAKKIEINSTWITSVLKGGSLQVSARSLTCMRTMRYALSKLGMRINHFLLKLILTANSCESDRCAHVQDVH